ncbi:hypothetical protein [Flavilitoribacter nigricans]|uniref:Uncharacterized protein n=1 Tax=Flavilitoribacter nigricans (strain ATCC 23147 / DSM 23189 / NBRC 102662 / NCIMB 1420 / SS-2) TaxID=1122177 RepID=A0A2D0MYA8_FLAN2|nr:hypothetical protein [Flavilitoribacter nigricans]PHN01271.1 hypothetical protein CRP01_37975 [Flavilitoribacter nigricans DSM 23189 = NBRC 102662]
MKTFTPTTKADQDSRIPQLAAQDWERREARGAKEDAAETRQKAILEALELAPHFDLYRLPQNFWVAVLPSGERSTQNGAARVGQKGSSPRSHKTTSTFPTEIAGCTDLYHISDHILFFRSNLPEPEIRENIDLSFLPF